MRDAPDARTVTRHRQVLGELAGLVIRGGVFQLIRFDFEGRGVAEKIGNGRAAVECRRELPRVGRFPPELRNLCRYLVFRYHDRRLCAALGDELPGTSFAAEIR